MSLLRRLYSAVTGVVLIAIVGSFLASVIHPAVPVLNTGTVVVTGCSPGGLGFQIVKDILDSQPKEVLVLCTVRKDADSKALADEFKSDRLKSVLLDVTDAPAVKKFGEKLENARIIGLVNNAGVSVHSKLESIDYRSTFEVNFFAVLEMVKTLLPHLRKAGPGSRIVNIGSMAGTFVRPGTIVYSSSKRALEAATDGMRVELAPDSISVSIVQPGFFRTKMYTAPQCGGGVEEVSEAVLHGLFASRPRTRYPVATIGAMSAFAGSKLAAALPDRLLDFAITVLKPKDVNPPKEKQ